MLPRLIFLFLIIIPIDIEIILSQSKEIVHSFHPYDYGIELDLNIFKSEVERWIHEIEPYYYKEMSLDRIDEDGEIIKGSPRIEVNTTQLLEEILKRSFTGGKIEIPLKITDSNYRLTDIPHLKEVVLASILHSLIQIKQGEVKTSRFQLQLFITSLLAAKIHFPLMQSLDLEKLLTVIK